MQVEVEKPKRSSQPVLFFTAGIAFGVGCLMLGQAFVDPPKAAAKEPPQIIGKLVAANLELPESLRMLNRIQEAQMNPTAVTTTEKGAALPCVGPPPPREISGSIGSRAIPFASGSPINVEPIRPIVPGQAVTGQSATPASTPSTTAPKAPDSPNMLAKVSEVARKYGATMPSVSANSVTLVVKKSDASSLMEDLTDLMLPVQQVKSTDQQSADVVRLQGKLDDAKDKRAKLTDADEIKKQDDTIEQLEFDLKKATMKAPAEAFVTLEVGLKPAK